MQTVEPAFFHWKYSPLRLNWREFEEQLKWGYLAGTETDEKPDLAKIGIMLSHAGKEARDVYKTLEWAAEADKN